MLFAEPETALAAMIMIRADLIRMRDKILQPAARKHGSTTIQQLTRRLNHLHEDSIT